MRKQPEMTTHWGKHSPLGTPKQPAMVMTKQQPRRIQTAMMTPPQPSLRLATHPNASPTPTAHSKKATLIPSAHPETHSAAMKRPAKPPGIHSAPLASSLALALRPHPTKQTRSATPKQKK